MKKPTRIHVAHSVLGGFEAVVHWPGQRTVRSRAARVRIDGPATLVMNGRPKDLGDVKCWIETTARVRLIPRRLK